MKYPQKAIFKISVSNKNYSYVTVQQLHSNKHWYFILKEIIVAETKALNFAFWCVKQTPPSAYFKSTILLQ